MALVKPDLGRFAKIKVVGVGGGGGNCINSMVEGNTITGVDFLAFNTDAQALLANKAKIKLQIGDNLTRGLGVGGNPELGKQAAEESREKIKELLMDTDMIFITSGMGGGTGTGASPIVAEIAKEVGSLVVAVVTKPFLFEGARRMVSAEDGIEVLKDKVDALIVIPNQRLMDTADKTMTLVEAFKNVDSVLSQGVQGISDIITVPGLINRDFADVRSIIEGAGSAFMGIGFGVGENRALTAAKEAIASPLLEVSIDGAQGILFTITGGLDLTIAEIEEISRVITEHADANANIIFGANVSEAMVDQVKVTIIATGFDQSKIRLQRMVNKSVQQPTRAASEDENPPSNGLDEEPQNIVDEMGEEYEVPAFLRLGKQN